MALLVEARYLTQRQPAGLAAALQRRGVTAASVDTDRLVQDLADPWPCGPASVVVARGRSESLLRALALAERRGIRTINCAAAIAGVCDKAVMGGALAAAGVPVPATWVGAPGELNGAIPAESYPLVLKPVRGDNGRGVRLVVGPLDMRRLGWPEPAALAQRFVAGDGWDLKVYGIGDRLWAVRKPSMLVPGPQVAEAVQPAPLPLRVGALARRCAALFGLDIFGVDLIVSGPDVVVIEVNDFPNFTGVAEADEALADYVLGAAGVGR